MNFPNFFAIGDFQIEFSRTFHWKRAEGKKCEKFKSCRKYVSQCLEMTENVSFSRIAYKTLFQLMNYKKSFWMFRSSDFSWRSAQTLALPTIATTVSFALTLAMHRTSGFRSTKCELRGSQPFFRAFTTLKRTFSDDCIAVCNEKLTCPYSHDPSRRPMA